MNRRFGSSHRLRELSGCADRSNVSRLAVFPEERPEHGKSLKEQIEERLGKQTKSAEEHEA